MYRCADRDMFMRYLGSGIGHRPAATDLDPKPMEISGVTEGDPDVEMNLEDVTVNDSEDANSNNTHFHPVDDIDDPNEDDYMQDDVPRTQAQAEMGEQDDELDDYDYRDTQEAEPDGLSDPDNEEDLADIDGCDLGAEDGENDNYLDSDLEYE